MKTKIEPTENSTLPALVRWNISCADEFDVIGFRVFPSLAAAASAVISVIKASKNDDEWHYVGSNESIGNLQESEFRITTLGLNQAAVLDSLFRESGIIQFGLGTEIFDEAKRVNADDDDDD